MRNIEFSTMMGTLEILGDKLCMYVQEHPEYIAESRDRFSKILSELNEELINRYGRESKEVRRYKGSLGHLTWANMVLLANAARAVEKGEPQPVGVGGAIAQLEAQTMILIRDLYSD